MMDITAWSAISPYGLDAASFAAGIRDGRPAATRAVPGFDQREVLGRKGTKAMDRVTGLAVAAARPLAHERDAAIVFGTTAGGVQTMSDFTRASLTGQRPYDVDPAVIPGVVMNCAAAQCAIWFGVTGPNATIAGGRVAGLLALAYGRRLLRAGRAAAVLCGAAEELSPVRSRLEPDVGDLGEGAAVLRLEPPGSATAIASVLAVDVAAGESIVRSARKALDLAGVTAAQVGTVVTVTRAERDALRGVCAAGGPAPVAELTGDAGAAAALFAVAAAITAAREPGELALIAAADPAGLAGAAVLRLAA